MTALMVLLKLYTHSSRLTRCPRSSTVWVRVAAIRGDPRFCQVAAIRGDLRFCNRNLINPTDSVSQAVDAHMNNMTGVCVPQHHIQGTAVNSLAFGSSGIIWSTVRLWLCLHDFASAHVDASTVGACSIVVELHGFVEPESAGIVEAATNQRSIVVEKLREC